MPTPDDAVKNTDCRVSIEFQISSFEIWCQNQLCQYELLALPRLHTSAYTCIQTHKKPHQAKPRCRYHAIVLLAEQSKFSQTLFACTCGEMAKLSVTRCTRRILWSLQALLRYWSQQRIASCVGCRLKRCPFAICY